MDEAVIRVKPLPLKVQDLTFTQWMIAAVSFVMVVGSACAFIVMSYCASSDSVCIASFGATGGALLLFSMSAAAYVLKHAFTRQTSETPAARRM